MLWNSKEFQMALGKAKNAQECLKEILLYVFAATWLFELKKKKVS